MPDRVTQRGVSAENVAGRDVNITYGDSPRSPLAPLVERYRAEAAEDQELRRFIEHIQFFLDPATEEPIGLERKLQLGGRSDDFRTASRLKETFYKKLLSHQLSPAAQEIFAHLLGFLHMRFQSRIAPLVAAGEPRAEIDAALESEVLEVTYQLIDDNVLSIHVQDLRGMLYYLTGNCHVKWHS